MQAFSSTVRDMYALAEYAAPDQFLTQAINLLQMWICFDGAIFGTGKAHKEIHYPCWNHLWCYRRQPFLKH